MFWQGILLLLAQNAVAWHSNDDLMSFVTLPDARAVKFNINYEHRDRVSPGYWFVSPYLHIAPDEPTSLYEQYQTGPHIYDQDGRLVWTGAPMFDNRNVFDFKTITLHNETYISLILQYSHDGRERGYGMILDQNYQVYRKIPLRKDLGVFDIHEFNVLDNGQSAVVTNYLSEEITLEAFGRPEEKTWLEYGGFAELDINTADVLYHWNSFAEVPLAETVHYSPSSRVEGAPGWDYVHINAVDKNDNGDYLISMRFTNTIYLVSGQTGTIVWRLGGQGNSDFAQDFVFSKQHDAKFVESSGTRHVISFLNNASDEEFAEEEISSALIVELETGTSPMTARVLNRYNRPDKGLTRLRGNSQLLANKNMFVCWSQGGYISEFSPEGQVLMSASFTSDRFSNYRAYKSEFIGRPNTPPDLVASVFGSDETNLITTVHVSWNGATDVAWWNFYAQASEFDTPVFIGNVSKYDFETMFIASGYMDWISVEAVHRDGHVMGTSKVHRTQFPDWMAAGYAGQSGLPRPQDPSKLSSAQGGTSSKKLSDPSRLSSLSDTADAEVRKAIQMLSNSYTTVRSIGGLFALILLLAVMSGIMASYLLIRGWRVRLYQRVPLEEGLSEEGDHLKSEMDE
ncbi:uncharacterized protein N7484_011474 [Penicillium longicatenatum]|uniref:uncharacterized protein n=1 Tax=Penicillium longicatenatum TaxID=1561947 RepID=UPI0025490B1C|nr:uncharacterized protein N7484_011474 [Penicillium longicatenatum]KAJ5631374.1 hypothetical protein N7484_011474 [Penicillium longicatenatum]